MGVDQRLRLGAGVTTILAATFPTALVGATLASVQTLTELTVSMLGNAANPAGSVVTFQVYKNGVAVAGANLTLAADISIFVPQIGSSAFSEVCAVGDVITVGFVSAGAGPNCAFNNPSATVQ